MPGPGAAAQPMITGTASGQGCTAALLFADEGATVVGADLNLRCAAETAEMVRFAGGMMTTSAEPVDLTDEHVVKAWIDDAAAAHGRIDVLYNAGATRSSPLETTTADDWSFVLRNEVDLVFLACKHAWPHLRAAPGRASCWSGRPPESPGR